MGSGSFPGPRDHRCHSTPVVPPDGNYIFKGDGLLVKYTLRLHRCSIGSLTDMPAWEAAQPRMSLPTLALPPGTMEFLKYGRKDHDTTS